MYDSKENSEGDTRFGDWHCTILEAHPLLYTYIPIQLQATQLHTQETPAIVI